MAEENASSAAFRCACPGHDDFCAYKFRQFHYWLRSIRDGGVDRASFRIKGEILAKRIDFIVEGERDMAFDGDKHVIVFARAY